MTVDNQTNKANTTDATIGQGLRARREARKAELQTAIAAA